MSGQPARIPSDVNRFRKEYMDTLELQEKNNDMNLQANKTYLLTGQLPPSSQIQDTRTNAEKLKDFETLKTTIANGLKPIAEPAFALAIVNKVNNEPLNADGALIRFLAQNAKEIGELLKKKYTICIAGDANDLDLIVSFIKNMYSAQQGKYQSVKSYVNGMDSVSSSRSNVLSSNDIDKLITELTDLHKNIMIMGLNAQQNNIANNAIAELRRIVTILKNCLPSTDEIKRLLEIIGNLAPVPDLNMTDIYRFFNLLEKLPKYSILNTMIQKARRAEQTKDLNSFILHIRSITSEFAGITDVNNLTDLENAGQRIKRVIARLINPPNPIMAGIRNAIGANPPGIPQVNPPGVPPAVPGHFVNNIRGMIDALTPDNIDEVIRAIIARADFHTPELMADPNYLVNYQHITHVLNGALPIDDNAKEAIFEILNANNLGYGAEEQKLGVSGLGLKKRRGRPRGAGIVHIPKPPNYTSFGINEVNKKNLEKGILTVRRNTRSNYPDMPSRRVSERMKGIISTIYGGGIPKYDEIAKLDDDEKEYLHKLVSRSNLEDRLSVPTPSKDTQDKDIHSYEVMKGQLMSGNDSKELVKKFKLLIVKLSRQKLLPKNEVNELLELLINLGF
jgi:hypothetical protein